MVANVKRTRTLTLLAVAMLVASVAAPLALAQDQADENKPDDAGPGNDSSQADERRRNGTGPPAFAPAGGIGQLSYENGSADGHFISFAFDESDGTVSNWSYTGDPIIDEIAWDAFAVDRAAAHGSVFLAQGHHGVAEDSTDNSTSAPSQHENQTDPPENGTQGNETEEDDGNETDMGDDDGNETEEDGDEEDHEIQMNLHDNPPAIIKVHTSANSSLEWTFADGVDVSQVDNWTVEVTTEDGFHAILWRDHGQGDLAADGQTVSVDGPAEVMFRVASHGGADMSEDARERNAAIAQAAAQGKVQSEVRVDLPEQAADQAREATADVVNYGNNSAKPQNVREGGLDLKVRCEEPGTVVMTLSDKVLAASSADDVEVTFDNETIEPADDLADVLETADDNAPEFLVVSGDNGTEVMVSVNACSVHTISIQEATQSALPGFGITAALAAIGTAAALAAAARRD